MFTDVVSLDKAAALIGGDKPVSRATIQRMIRDGVLEARGKGQLRRVTVRSIDAYNSGDTAWDGDDPQVRAVPFRTQAASGGPKSRQATADGGALVVLTPRTPRRHENDW